MISGDGGGEKRAYNHLITGTQHCLNIYSLVTKKILTVVNHQISCKSCALKLTAYLKETGKNPFHILPGEVDLSHDGVCHRNTSYSPATAEEDAYKIAGKWLLDLPDDEAIFGEAIVSDGDTRGPDKFISVQVEITGVKSMPKKYPDFGHFLKCESNGIYALAEKKHLKGKKLLEPPRIRAMIGDLARHLKQLHAKRKQAEDLGATKNDINKLNNTCFAAVHSIVPHHCGDHSKCTVDDCLYLQIKRDVSNEFKEKVSNGTTMPQDASNEVVAAEVNNRYSQQSRFKGVTMSMSSRAQDLVMHELLKRLTPDNIDSVAKLFSSNLDENYFGMLIKHTEGKRLYFGQSDTWQVLCLYVGARQSNSELPTLILKRLGVYSQSRCRLKAREKLQKRHDYNKKRKTTEEYALRRTISKQQKLHVLTMDSRSSSRHISDKTIPGRLIKRVLRTSTKVNIAKSLQPRKKRSAPASQTCSNCGCKGHTRKVCAELEISSTTSIVRLARKKPKLDIDQMLEVLFDK